MADFNQAKRGWGIRLPLLTVEWLTERAPGVGNGFLEPHETAAIFNAWGRLRLTVF